MKIENTDYRLLFESLPGLYLVLDPQLNIVTASDAYLHATMTMKEKIAGKYIFDVFPDNPDDPEADGVTNLEYSLNYVLKNKVPHTMQLQKYDIRRPDGTFEKRSWRPLNTPILNTKQEVIWIIHQVEDATDLVRMKKELSNRELLAKSNAAIYELNVQLEKRADDLEESNQELERFAYIASHDLQEPLRMVSSFLQLLKKKYQHELDETALQYINYAVDGSDRMKKLIQDLLEYSRVGVNKDDYSVIQLDQLLKYVTSLFKDELNSCGATLKINPLPEIEGRKPQFTQLFQNLISNSIKYRSREPLHIEIGCIERPREWEFFITDNGIGIDPKYNEKIFIIFQRLHNRAEYAGTGIGLSICRKIVERHRGKMWVESSLGKGSTFRFTIPK